MVTPSPYGQGPELTTMTGLLRLRELKGGIPMYVSGIVDVNTMGRVYKNSCANNLTPAFFALSSYFDGDGIHSRNCTDNA